MSGHFKVPTTTCASWSPNTCTILAEVPEIPIYNVKPASRYKEDFMVDTLGSRIQGSVRSVGDAMIVATVDLVFVHPDYHRRGAGTSLYKAFADLAINYGGATHLAGDVTEASLKTRLALFDADSTTYYRHRNELMRPRYSISKDKADTILAATEECWRFSEELDEKYGYADDPDKMPPLLTVLGEEDQHKYDMLTNAQAQVYAVTSLEGIDISNWAADSIKLER